MKCYVLVIEVFAPLRTGNGGCQAICWARNKHEQSTQAPLSERHLHLPPGHGFFDPELCSREQGGRWKTICECSMRRTSQHCSELSGLVMEECNLGSDKSPSQEEMAKPMYWIHCREWCLPDSDTLPKKPWFPALSEPKLDWYQDYVDFLFFFQFRSWVSENQQVVFFFCSIAMRLGKWSVWLNDIETLPYKVVASPTFGPGFCCIRG